MRTFRAWFCLFVLTLIIQQQALAVINVAAIWETWPTSGADTNGGFFVPGIGGTEVSAAANLSVDSGTNTKVTATHTFIAGDAKRWLNITAAGTLSGTYVSGGTITGSATQTCTLTAFNNGSTSTATVALTGTNVIATGTALAITAAGASGTAPSTSATLGNGTATCSGTATIQTVLNMTLGWYRIESVTSGAAILDRSPGAVSTLNGTYTLYSGVDGTQSATPVVNIDNATITATCGTNTITFTGATYTPTKNDVGNGVHLTATTGVTAGWYEITNFSATTWTVSGAAAACTAGPNSGVIGAMGGATATLSAIAGTTGIVAQNIVFIKQTGTLAITATNTFAQTATPSSTVAYTRYSGYKTVRGDGGAAANFANAPTIQASTNTGINMLSFTGSGVWLEHLILDCNSLGTCTPFTMSGNNAVLSDVKIINFSTFGARATNTGILIRASEITGGVSGCTGAVSTSANTISVRSNFIHDNACGLALQAGVTVEDNFITNNTGTTTDGVSFIGSTFPSSIRFNTIYKSGRHGLAGSAASAFVALSIQNNVITDSGGCGFQMWTSPGSPSLITFDGNGFWNNAQGPTCNMNDEGNSNNPNMGPAAYRFSLNQNLSSTPFTNAPGGDFSLNDTALAGHAVRQSSLPGSWPGNTITSFRAMGAAQPQPTAGAAGGTCAIGF